MQLLTTTLLATGLICLSVSSQAQTLDPAKASIDWSTFSYRLYDLNPLDDHNASLTWSNQYTLGVNGSVQHLRNDWTSPINTIFNGSSGVFGAAEYTIGVTADSANLSVANSLYAPQSFAAAIRSGDFTLSPMTLAIFSVSASVSAPRNPDIQNLIYCGQCSFYYTEWPTTTSATAKLSVGNTDVSPYNRNDSYLYVVEDGIETNQSGLLTVSYANDTDSNVTARLSAVTSVPEPHTYGMLLAGLAVMTQIARRRKS